MRLIVRTDAEEDVAAGYSWYEEQRRGLGAEFLEELSSTIAAIELNPLQFRRLNPIMRRALVRRFPYGIDFIVLNELLFVIAVTHLARDPRRVNRRLR